MHIPDEAQVLLVTACFADGAPPFFYSFKNLHLHPAVSNRRAFWEATNKLIEEFLGADLQVEGIATVLDADVKQAQSQYGHTGIAVVHIVDDGHGGFAWGGALLGVDQVGDLEVEGQVWLVVFGAAGALDEALELGGSMPPSSPWVSGGRSCAGRLHRDSRSRRVKIWAELKPRTWMRVR